MTRYVLVAVVLVSAAVTGCTGLFVVEYGCMITTSSHECITLCLRNLSYQDKGNQRSM